MSRGRIMKKQLVLVTWLSTNQIFKWGLTMNWKGWCCLMDQLLTLNALAEPHKSIGLPPVTTNDSQKVPLMCWGEFNTGRMWCWKTNTPHLRTVLNLADNWHMVIHLCIHHIPCTCGRLFLYGVWSAIEKVWGCFRDIYQIIAHTFQCPIINVLICPDLGVTTLVFVACSMPLSLHSLFKDHLRCLCFCSNSMKVKAISTEWTVSQ